MTVLWHVLQPGPHPCCETLIIRGVFVFMLPIGKGPCELLGTAKAGKSQECARVSFNNLAV